MLADVTLIDFLHANWGSIAAILGALGVALSGGAAWFVRVIWTWIVAALERHEQRSIKSSAKVDTLVETLTVESPKQTLALATISTSVASMHEAVGEGFAETRKRDSDVVREIRRGQEAAGQISYGLEELADPAMAPHVKRYTERAREMLGTPPRKESPP